MVNRDNWKLTKEYIAYLAEVRQLNELTITSAWTAIRHLLEWSDETPFSKSPDIRPTFPRYLADRIAPKSSELFCGHARRFFIWLRLSKGKRYASPSELWIGTITPPRAPSGLKEYHEYTLDDVRSIVTLPEASLVMKRDQAAAAFLFLSGMRVGAFASLPIECVDLDKLEVKQFPDKGVRTKRMKKATTFLLNLEDLLLVARSWNTLVREALPVTALWYAPITVHGTFSPDAKARDAHFEVALRHLCDLAGIEYRNPHNLRHGFAVYGLKHAKTIADMEAVSKNLMHDSLATTLKIYAVLNQADVKARIAGLGSR